MLDLKLCVRLLRLLGRVARRVRPAARLVRPPVPSARARLVRLLRLLQGVSHDASRQRPDSSDHESRRLGPDSCDSSDSSICRTTRRAGGPTRQTRGRPQAGSTRPTRQTPRRFCPLFWSAGAVVCALPPLHTFDMLDDCEPAPFKGVTGRRCSDDP